MDLYGFPGTQEFAQKMFMVDVSGVNIQRALLCEGQPDPP